MPLIDSPEKRDALISNLLMKLDMSKAWDVSVTQHIEHRSQLQNDRLWLAHRLAAAQVGCSPDELHEIMLCKHFGYQEIEYDGETRRVPLKRSSTRNKQEFSEYLDFVENSYAEKLGVWIGQDEAA